MSRCNLETIAAALEAFLGGVPRFVPTAGGAKQWIGPNGNVVRFDLEPGQYGREGPHINLESANLPRTSPDYFNKHVRLR
ncbi:MAG: hypothetical protein AVDCRST_MAG90-3390 [uncultured Microvirga sp.]|uniref:Uncharacterized protein n=1 Tax=uncultured Microvirga sp. TaxID=412392 RepID=A0A6J4MSY3_9HYPH|nr:MAG: hypothetical protein AVDCRST_MAG90-3390 [uncultured Microvirga sp.]